MSLTVLVHGRAPQKEPRHTGLSFDAPRIVLGRGAGCEVRLPDVSVSARHATIRQRGSEYLLIDEGSTNGTRMGRVRLSPQSPRVIRSGELARIGRVWLEFRFEATPASNGGAQAAKEVALALVAEALAAEGEDARPRVTIEEGVDAGRVATIEPGTRLVIGRSSEVELSVDDPDLSRRHAEIGQKGDVLVVRDLGSKAGTCIGDKPVGTSDVVWRSGEKLSLGGLVLSYAYPAAEALIEIERGPDERVAASDLDDSGPGAVVDAPEDVIEDDASLPTEEDLAPLISEDESYLERPEPRGKHQRWGATDFAVVMFAFGVLSLSVVGYFILLK